MAIKSFNITVCASGGGGNFRSLAKHQFDCGYRISLLVVDRECFAIDVAKEYGIPYTVLYRKFLNKSFFEEYSQYPQNLNLYNIKKEVPQKYEIDDTLFEL